MERQIRSRQSILGQIMWKKDSLYDKKWAFQVKQLNHFVFQKLLTLYSRVRFYIPVVIATKFFGIFARSVFYRFVQGSKYAIFSADARQTTTISKFENVSIFREKRFNCLGFTNSINRGFLHTLSRGIRWMF